MSAVLIIDLLRFYLLPMAGRAKKKMEELEKLLEIAIKNYTQLGGTIQAVDQNKQDENRVVKW